MFHIGTEKGIFAWDEENGPLAMLGPDAEQVGQVVVSNDGSFLAAVGGGSTVWQRRGDEGWTRVPLQAPGVRPASLLLAPDGETVYLGTEPGALYRKGRDEAEWELVCALHTLPLASDWHTPWGGPAAIRTIAAKWDGANGDKAQLYLDIHVGGILRTIDGGRSYTPINRGLEEDVHQVATHPLALSRVYAATADGFYLSGDEGETWERRNHGLDNLYCRGIAVSPLDPDFVLVSGSPFSPGGWRQSGPQFALYRTEDAGQTWTRITNGLPDPFSAVIDSNCIAFSRQHPETVLCAAGTAIYVSGDAGRSWRQLGEALPKVTSLVGS